LVKFIYPDLYRVKVFEGGELMKAEDIEGEIKIYLQQKVERYNTYLSEQLTKAPGYYALHDNEYNFLAEVDIAASPNRSYELLPSNYLVGLIGETAIKRAAESLYHLNVGWKDQRPQGSTVGDYIEDARKTFDINDKIEFVLDEYLRYDKEEFYFDPIAYPTHIEKDFAYEAGLIVSDALDVVRDKDPDTPPPTLADNAIVPPPGGDYGDTSHD